MFVPLAMWLIGFGLTTVQLLIRIGAAACAGAIDAVDRRNLQVTPRRQGDRRISCGFLS